MENRLDNLEEVDIEDVTLDELMSMQYSKPLMDMAFCPKCKYIFYKTDDTIYTRSETFYNPVYDGFDSYHEEESIEETEQIKCPKCGYKEDADEFPDAYTDSIEDAINAEELVPGITDYLNNLD